MLDPATWKDVSEVLANIATAFGLVTIPFVLNSYRREASQQRREAETATFLSLNAMYIDWLKLCFDNPELEAPNFAEIGTIKQANDPTLMQNPDWKREQLAFVILTSMFEQAFFLYHDKSDDFRSSQWNGWVSYIGNYIGKDTHIEYWKYGGGTFYDSRFVEFMQDTFGALRPTSGTPLPPSSH